MKLKIERAMLVYQGGIANVFAVDCFNLLAYGRNARRLHQGSFRTCETYVRGLGAAGTIVHTAACNQAGDIAEANWSEDLDAQPFSENFRPVELNTTGVTA
jgi:hypothetical protein